MASLSWDAVWDLLVSDFSVQTRAVPHTSLQALKFQWQLFDYNRIFSATWGGMGWWVITSFNVNVKAPAHQTDNQENAATKIGSCVVFCLSLSHQKVALFTPQRQQLATNARAKTNPSSQMYKPCYDSAAFFEPTLDKIVHLTNNVW